MKTTRAFVGALMMAFAASADTFKADNAVGDIASADFWRQNYGKSGAPGIDDTVELAKKATGPTFTVGSDLSINDIQFAASGAYVTLQSGVTVSLKAKTAMTFTTRNMGMRLTGGTWDFANTGNLYCGTARSTPVNNRTIQFMGGTTVNNVNAFYASFYDTLTTVSFEDASKLNTKDLWVSYGNTASNTVLKFIEGSVATVTGTFETDGLSDSETAVKGKGGTQLLVSGTDSAIRCTGSSTSHIGFKVPGNEVVVTDHAQLSLADKLYVGNSAGSGDNAMTVSDGGSVSCGHFRIGMAAGADGNRVTVDNGTITGRGALVAGYASSGNRLKILNGSTVSCTQLFLGQQATATNNEILISGARTYVSVSSGIYDPFGAGDGNALIVEDGASLSAAGFYVATNSANNVLRFRSAAFEPGSHFYLGFGAAASRGNRLEILDGATFAVNSFNLSSFDNAVVVSNGTLTAADASRGMRIGYVSAGMVSSNCTVVVQGETPSLVSNGPISLGNDARLHFDVPADGYASAPITVAKKMTVGADTLFTASVEAFREKTGGKTVLVRTSEGITDSNDGRSVAAAIAASNALMPSRCRFKLSADGKELILRTPSHSGMLLICR